MTDSLAGSLAALKAQIKLVHPLTLGILLHGLAGVTSLPVNAYGANYRNSPFKYEVDRFTGVKSASYTTTSGCRQTKGIKGSVHLCLFINSTESSRYPRLSVMKVNNGWDLLGTRQSQAPAIVTYLNGSRRTMSLPTNMTTGVLHGGEVSEWVAIETKSIPNQSQIKTIEWQYGSSEFSFSPDKTFHCVARLAKSC